MEIQDLQCTVAVEQLGSSGQTLRRKTIKNALIQLGRDEVRDIVLKIGSEKAVELQFLLKDAKFHSRFIKSGKASVSLQDGVNLMISNCPPQKLYAFLKGASVKLAGVRSFASDRKRLYSFKMKSFMEISPLTNLEVQSYRKQISGNKNHMNVVDRVPVIENKEHGIDKTPKRKRSELEGSRKKPKTLTNMNESKENAQILDRMIRGSALTVEQKRIIDSILRGRNVFFTGSAGTGKTVLLKRIIGLLPPESTVVSASTGVAACQIGGVTLHSFAGIGCGTADLERCVELAKRSHVAQQWRKCRCLIIDEISMVDGEFFDKIEQVAQNIRKSSAPFGGIQLIVCGDFLQLPPVSKGKTIAKFCFQSEAWSSCIDDVFELTQVHRQKDPQFVSILQYLRVGRCPDKVLSKLKGTSGHKLNKHGITATRLCTHRSHVSEINAHRMNALSGEKRGFPAFDSEDAYSKQMDNVLPVQRTLHLKVGAQVMLVKNLDVSKGLVNGARGVVVSFAKDGTGNPVVHFQKGNKETIKPEKFVFKLPSGNFVTRSQIPLQLAWAISIHKSQGLSLDCVEVSLANVFEHGQAYVALSRATCLEGLRVVDIDQQNIKAHPDVLRFYIHLRKQLRLETEILQSDTSCA